LVLHLAFLDRIKVVCRDALFVAHIERPNSQFDLAPTKIAAASLTFVISAV